jgi:hypothetical protein
MGRWRCEPSSRQPLDIRSHPDACDHVIGLDHALIREPQRAHGSVAAHAGDGAIGYDLYALVLVHLREPSPELLSEHAKDRGSARLRSW